jgi:hypothetical protein
MKNSWGKPTILVADLDATTFEWKKIPTPADGTTQLSTTAGDKTEALIEGGAVEDVKYAKNKYSLQYNIRALKGRKKPIQDNDGVVTHNYAVLLQPEDASCSGFLIQLSAVSVENTFTSADGKAWLFKHDALQLEDETNQVKDGVATITYGTDGAISKVTFSPDDSEKTYDITGTEQLTKEATA